MRALILAVRFLTIVPVPGHELSGPGALGRAAWWFPVVGLGIGFGLAGLDRVLAPLFTPLLSALLVVSAWKIVTGGIHLDGLADCLDGIGGRDPAQRLAIMRDSRVGVFGAVGLIVTFLADVVALAEVPAAARWRVVFIAPALGRLAPVLIGAWLGPGTPCRGWGAPFLGALSRRAGPLHLVWSVPLAAWLVGPAALPITLAPLAAMGLWAWFMHRRLGGLTGDVLGSLVELAELGVLLMAAAVIK
jgi:adenosylcobinamide-GDP ribazoletransferase